MWRVGISPKRKNAWPRNVPEQWGVLPTPMPACSSSSHLCHGHNNIFSYAKGSFKGIKGRPTQHEKKLTNGKESTTGTVGRARCCHAFNVSLPNQLSVARVPGGKGHGKVGRSWLHLACRKSGWPNRKAPASARNPNKTQAGLDG